MNIIIIVQLIAFVVILLGNVTNGQKQFNQLVGTNNQSMIDMTKQIQINTLLAKCSSTDPNEQCDVCSLCQNGAFCRQTKNKKSKQKFNTDPLSALREIIDFNCYCVPGYTGTYCQIDINECLSMPCSNNATCIDKINSFECDCPKGFKGEYCEINIDECESSPCLYDSKCIDLIDAFHCECMPGYTGTTCSIDINECETKPCANNATCLNLVNKFECNCSNTGFQGALCEIDINDCLNVECQHNSTCADGINAFECKCQPGFTGRYCEIDIDECLSSPCVYGKCWQNSDPKGFIRRVERLGTLPPSSLSSSSSISHQRISSDQIIDPNQLDLSFEYKFNYDKAAGYWCECTPGYSGINCETKINECEHNPCGKNGNCLDQINEYKCDCYPGYTGQNCQENINECLSISPCAEQTKCIDLKPDYSVSNLTNNTLGYYCDCNELNLNLFKLNKNRYVSYTGVNCTIKVNSCEANNNLCQHDSVCESVLIDNKQDVKCSCKPGFTGKYCQYLTVIRLDGTYSPESQINFSNNSKFHLKFDFRIQSYMNKLPLVYFATSNSLLFEVNIFRKYLSISNKNMNIDEKLAFYENNNTWHSFELIKTNDDNNLKLVYSVQQLHLTQTKLISHFNEMAKNDSMIIKFGKFFTNNNKKDYLSSSCIRDVKLNDEYLFVSNNKNTNKIVKFGCDMIKNECNKNYCKNGASCVYKWFTNECTNCLHPFYGKQCQLEATKLGLLNKSPASPLSAYVTLGLIRSSRSDTFKMSFQITHINNNDSDEPEQFLFLTLKQLDQNEKMEYFYILSIDENGYLNMKKIQFNLVDLSKTLKWSLSNDKFNLSDVNTFKLNVKMSEFFIELTVDKYISRFELIEEEKSSSLFQIEQIKFSNNFILNNSVSFMITDLRVNDVNYEFSMNNETKLQINTLNSLDDVSLEIIESLNANLFNSSQNNNDIIFYLNENEHSCPNKNCYKLKEFKQQEFLIKNITCNYINNQCNQYSSIRRNLYKSKNKAELNYYFNFDKNILEENDLMNKTAQIDSNSFNKQRILMLRDIDFYSIGFDLNLNFLKKEINSNFKTNLFILNSLDDANSISKFLFGLNLIVTNQTESGQFIFELFTAKQSIQSGVVKIDELINVNLTFTFNSIDLRINNSSQELMKLTDKTTSLFYRSLLKAYASFQLSLVSNLLNDQPDEYNNRPEAEMSACFSHFYLVTRKINNKLRKYDLIDQVKSIFMIDDLVNNDLNEKCGTTTSDSKSLFFDEQEQRSMIKKDCYLVSKFNANTNEKLNDYYVCKCNTTTEQLCPYNFWSKLDDNSAREQTPTEEATTALLSCAELNDYACFNNGTCIDNRTQIDNYSCSCAKYFTGKRCEIFDACLSNSCSLQSTCKPKATEFIPNTSLFECICDYGYIGEYCTIRVNETCLANPCMNGATCFNVTEIDDLTKMSYECKCTPGFEGKDCQHQIDFCLLNEPCDNGASCINLYHQETMYKCGCTKGWKGVNCSVDIDECELMKAKQTIPCSGNGQCLNTKGDFKCVCNQYNYGKNCESTHICKQDPYERRPCENGAICLINGDIHFNKYICKCGYGYTGVNCSYPTCDIQPCRHDSTCEMINSTNYECNCTGTGHVGKTCETFVNDIECHMFACNNNTCDPSKCDCKAINCEEYISKYMKPKPKEFMYHFILWPLLGIMFTLLMILFSIFLMKMKKSRATHGTYSPSRHELQASRIEFNMDLKRPPEERLI